MKLRILNEGNENNDEIKLSNRQKRKREIADRINKINRNSYKDIFSHAVTGGLSGALIGGVKGALNNGIGGAISGAVKGSLMGAAATGLTSAPIAIYANKKNKNQLKSFYKGDLISRRLFKLHNFYQKKNEINENDSNEIKEIKKLIIDNNLTNNIFFTFDENNKKLSKCVFNINFWKKYSQSRECTEFIFMGNKRIKDIIEFFNSDNASTKYKYLFLFKGGNILYGALSNRINIKKFGDCYVYFVCVIPNKFIVDKGLDICELLVESHLDCIKSYDDVHSHIYIK